MIFHHEAGRWEPENEKEAEEYDAYMQETMGGRLLSDDDLRAIEERAEKATPGPWWVEGSGMLEVVTLAIDLTPGSPDGPTYSGVSYNPTVADAEFIAYARTGIPRLVAALREERAVRLELQHDARREANEAEKWRLLHDKAAEDAIAAEAEVTHFRAEVEESCAQLRAEVERLTNELERVTDMWHDRNDQRKELEAEVALLRGNFTINKDFLRERNDALTREAKLRNAIERALDEIHATPDYCLVPLAVTRAETILKGALHKFERDSTG